MPVLKDPSPHGGRISRLKIYSFFVLLAERLSTALWAPLVWALGYFALALFGVPALFGAAIHVFFFALFIGGLLFWLWRGFRGFSWPQEQEIERRIERDSGVKHRPLSGIYDRPVNDQRKDARDLWTAGQKRLWAALALLKPARLRAFMAARDPYALRLLTLTGFALGVIVAGPLWQNRITESLSPFSLHTSGTHKTERFTIWITPPDYTKLPQLVLQDNTIKDEAVLIPQGSAVKATVNGGWGTPRLGLGDNKITFETSGQGTYTLEAQAPDQNGNLRLTQGFSRLAAWPYKIIPDTPPEISLINPVIPTDRHSDMAGAEESGDGSDPSTAQQAAPLGMTKGNPEILGNGSLRFSLSVRDDYGVEYLTMQMRLDEIVEDAPLGWNVEEQRSVISPAGQNFEIAPVYDLTAHPWAGLPVVFDFTVSDVPGQTGTLKGVSVRLPERDFQHPVAKTLVSLRKKLAWQPDSAPVYAEIRHDLNMMLTAPAIFHHDPLVYLAMRVAASRLHYAKPSVKTAWSVMALLWDTALRVEDGDLSLTARKLREAQMALEEALQNPDITDEEIAALMNDLRQAMTEYFQELGREMQKRMASGQPVPMITPEMMDQALSPDALAEFLEQMESEMRDGNRQSAQEMLSRMQRLMDILDPSMNAQMPQDMQMMQEAVNELQNLIERQEDLLAQTQDQAEIFETLEQFGLNYGQSLPRDSDLLDEWGMGDVPPAPDQKARKDLPFINTQDNRAEQ
ncbi:MAG: DUF4175 domain-containing protein, partial [Bdellovibrionales bacterium]